MKYIKYAKIKENIVGLIKEQKHIMLVLKDNAYNFGIKEIAEIAIFSDVKSFAVKSIEEAIIIRKLSFSADILLLGKMIDDIDKIKKYNIILSVDCLSELKYCLGNKINYHLKLNSEMNRFGVKEEDIEKYISPFLKGIYIHVPTADVLENMNEVKKLDYLVKKYSLDRLFVHIGGSNILMVDHPYHYRIGSYIYNDALEITGKIIAIRKILKGEALGYNHEYVASNDTLVGICNLGYVNGLSRINTDNYVLINNKRYPFIGLKCMDSSFILIDETIKINDEVVVIGDSINMDEFCLMNKMIPHEAYLRLN